MASFTTVPSYNTWSGGSKLISTKGLVIIYEGRGEEKYY